LALLAGEASAPLVEKVLQQFHAFRRKNPLADYHPVIQQLRIGNPELAADSSEAEISSTENEPADSRRDQGPGAHHTRLESNVKSGILQSIVLRGGGGCPKDQHFGMGGRIVRGDRGVMGSAYDFAIRHEYRADRNFAFGGGESRLSKRLLHP
jgi:hypothetical protein